MTSSHRGCICKHRLGGTSTFSTRLCSTVRQDNHHCGSYVFFYASEIYFDTKECMVRFPRYQWPPCSTPIIFCLLSTPGSSREKNLQRYATEVPNSNFHSPGGLLFLLVIVLCDTPKISGPAVLASFDYAMLLELGKLVKKKNCQPPNMFQGMWV